MTRIFAALICSLVVSASAFSEPYVEVGIGASLTDSGTQCIKGHTNGDCSQNPLGFAAIGYEYNGFTMSVEHWSSLVEKDYGANIVSIKYRYTFGQ